MLAAEPFSGKSMFGLALGLALTEGKEFLGAAVQQANVLYVGVDAARWDYGVQIRKLLHPREAPEGFHFLHEPFQLLDKGWRARIGAYIRAHAIQLVIFDTLRAMHDKQENDSGEMQTVMNELRAISVEYGTTALFLHHCPKPGIEGTRSNYRGSSVLLGSVDVFISMRAEKVDTNARTLTLTCEKGRGVKAMKPVTIKLAWDDDASTASLSLATWAAPVPIRSLEDAVDSRLAQGPATITELVELVPSDRRARKTIRNKVDAYLQKKRRGGVVEAVLKGGQNVWHLTRAVGKVGT